MFDTGQVVKSSHDLAREALAQVSDRVEAGPPAELLLPVLPPLRTVLPGLRRGQVIQAQAGSLVLALTAGASAGGSWCGIVGMPDFGVLAAAAMGCDIDQLLLVDEPGERWVEVVATLVEAVDVVVVRPPARPPPGVVRRLTALVRKFRSCLLVVGPWDGAMLRLRVTSSLWTGVSQGHGHLRGRRVKVVAEGRGSGGRSRSAWLWLPGPDGTVSGADLVQVGSPGEDPAPPSGRISTGAYALPAATHWPPVRAAAPTAGVA